MKLRLLGDSIRLRLTQGEVQRIGAGETVVETTAFADGARFEFALGPGEVDGVVATFDGGRLAVVAGADLLHTWSSTDRVALVEPVPGVSPRVLVEKDFNCLMPREGDDDEDTYPHPEEGERHC